jgi:hypothetical protein
VVVAVLVHQVQGVMEAQAAAVTGHHQLFRVDWVLLGKVIMAAMVVPEWQGMKAAAAAEQGR